MMAVKLRGRREFSLLVNSEMRTFTWQTRAERDAVVVELRRARMNVCAISKAIGLSRSWVQEVTARANPRRARVTQSLAVRTNTYDLVVRYALRHKIKICDAAAILIDKGVEAVGFELEPKK